LKGANLRRGLSLRIWLILIGVLAILGIALWLSSTAPEESEPAQPESTPQEERTGEEQGSIDLSQFLCPGAEALPKPEPLRPTLRVVAACVELEGLFWFGSRLPDTGDYLLKVRPFSEYVPLREACRVEATEPLRVEPELVVIVRGEDWPEIRPLLQPEGSFRYAIPVRVRGVYVFSTETNRHVYGPHCAIYPLEKLELLKEEEDK